MMLRYSPEARADLREIRRYISDTLGNPNAAERITGDILRNCSSLKQFPMLGMRLSEKIHKKTDLRFLVCGNHIAFYRIAEDSVSVTRILDGRSNYLAVLFSEDNITQ